jgi:hypothetical protein
MLNDVTESVAERHREVLFQLARQQDNHYVDDVDDRVKIGAELEAAAANAIIAAGVFSLCTSGEPAERERLEELARESLERADELLGQALSILIADLFPADPKPDWDHKSAREAHLQEKRFARSISTIASAQTPQRLFRQRLGHRRPLAREHARRRARPRAHRRARSRSPARSAAGEDQHLVGAHRGDAR